MTSLVQVNSGQCTILLSHRERSKNGRLGTLPIWEHWRKVWLKQHNSFLLSLQLLHKSGSHYDSPPPLIKNFPQTQENFLPLTISGSLNVCCQIQHLQTHTWTSSHSQTLCTHLATKPIKVLSAMWRDHLPQQILLGVACSACIHAATAASSWSWYSFQISDTNFWSLTGLKSLFWQRQQTQTHRGWRHSIFLVQVCCKITDVRRRICSWSFWV